MYNKVTTTDFYHSIKGAVFPETQDSTDSFTEAAADVIEQASTVVDNQASAVIE